MNILKFTDKISNYKNKFLITNLEYMLKVKNFQIHFFQFVIFQHDEIEMLKFLSVNEINLLVLFFNVLDYFFYIRLFFKQNKG